MAGFIRRFGFFPGVEVITQIEGVVIVDLPPPGAVQGVGTGTAAIVGEFADMSSATKVDSANGNVSSFHTAVEIFSSQDMIDKLGGFDETLGEFGGDMGNGFVELRNKKFSRLVAVPVNLASSRATRLWRELPTNKGASDARAAVTVQSGTVAAGREFRSGQIRVRVAKRVVFTDFPEKATGIDANTTVAAAAATQIIAMATGDFLNKGVLEGDILVLGVVGATPTSYLDQNAGTYRVVSVDSATQLTVQRMDGTNFAWVDELAAAQPWRIYLASNADSGEDHQLSEVQGYLIPARPLTNNTGGATDGTIVAGTLLSPAVTPPAITMGSADPLSGLKMRVHPTDGLTFTADVQKPNAPNDSGNLIEALYSLALDALLVDVAPAREVNLVWAARKADTIRTALKTHVLRASERHIGRVAFFSPELNNQSIAGILATADPGVGANRDERVIYSWPGVRTFVQEAVNFKLATSDGKTTTDGILDVTSDGWALAVCSNLAPERNPGQAGPPVPGVLAPMLGFQRGLAPLGLDEYISLRSNGIMAPRFDRVVGPIFQSGITTSLTSGQKNVNRRRMADFIEDSLAARFVSFAKLPLTNQLKDAVAGEAVAFLTELLSPNNPAAQRITAFEVDTKSGNTPTLEAKGVFVVIVRVRTLATADFIVLQAEIGEGVTITTS